MENTNKKKLTLTQRQVLAVFTELTSQTPRGYRANEILTRFAEQKMQSNARLPNNHPAKRHNMNLQDWCKLYQSRVSRALGKLHVDEFIFKDDGKNAPYYSRTPQIVKKLILEEVCFTSPEVFPFSTTVFLIRVSQDSIEAAQKRFFEYFGRSNCFDIIPFDKYLMLLFRQQAETTDSSGNKLAFPKTSFYHQELSDIAQEGYPLRETVAAKIKAQKALEKKKEQSKNAKESTSTETDVAVKEEKTEDTTKQATISKPTPTLTP